jgi:hypothetical protein
MYLYKLPEENQFIFTKERSLYNLYSPNEIADLLLVPEKIYQKHEKHFGRIDSILFKYSALEILKELIKKSFTSNQFNLVQKSVLSFFINQFQISKAQYEETLQTTLQEEYSFDLQVQLAKYQLIKRQHPSNSIHRFLGRFGF